MAKHRTVETLTPKEAKRVVAFLRNRVLKKDAMKFNMKHPITIEEIKEMEELMKKMEG
jgi:hypothetical protein